MGQVIRGNPIKLTSKHRRCRGGMETEGKKGQEREREREREGGPPNGLWCPWVSVVRLVLPLVPWLESAACSTQLRQHAVCTRSTWSAYSQPTACMRSARGQLVVSLLPACGHRMVSIRPAFAHTLSEDHQQPAAHSYVSMRPVHSQYMVSIQSA